MGVQRLGELMIKKPISMEELSGRTLAIDALNYLYAFLSVVRQPDGTPLMDRRMRVTSHLSGVFYRTVNLLESDIQPIFVFDGEVPVLKKETVKARRETREVAKEKWEEALTLGDLAAARKYAQLSSSLSDEMIKESKVLMDCIGVPWVQAPSEGEAQAAYMTKKGDAWSTGSQDYDSILFSSPTLVRNIVISGRRKLPGKNVYVKIEPELVDAEQSFNNLGVTKEQLIEVSILLGTDYNPGIKGVGPKTALKLVREHGSADRVIKEKGISMDVSVDDVRALFLNPKITEEYEVKPKQLNKEKTIHMLVDEHDFSLERVQAALKRIDEVTKPTRPAGLDQWL